MHSFLPRAFAAALLGLLSFAVHAHDAPAQARPTVSVVTLNLYHDKADWPKRRVQIAETLREFKPDVVALQEVIQTEALPNQAEWLAGELGYQVRFTSTDAPGKVHRYGNALLTPHRIVAHGEQALAPLEDSRTAMRLRIEVHGREVDVFNTHLHHTAEGTAIRGQQVAGLVQFIDQVQAPAPAVVAGDFNALADAPELAPLRQRFADSFGTLHPDAGAEATTLNLAWFDAPRRIDHIFFDRGRLLPLGSEILFTQPDADGTWASDHHGVLSVFAFLD